MVGIVFMVQACLAFFLYLTCLRVYQIDGRIILKWMFKKWDGLAWTELIWLRIGTDGGLL
jgi:hypothetical protein